ncbi:MAG TPA: hypothetical protein VGD17_11210 [Chitinophagaceae bacterium]
MKLNFRFIIPGILILFTGCYYDKEELLYPESITNCTAVNARFTDVKPIILSKCATSGCHNAQGKAGGIMLETYDQVKAVSARINQRVIIERSMPPGSPLTVGEITVLKCWINSGTPNN